MSIQHNPRAATGQPVLSFAELRSAQKQPTADELLQMALQPTAIAPAAPKNRAAAPAPTPAQIAVRYLRDLDPIGRHNLVALDPEKKLPPEGMTFAPEKWAEMHSWIIEREGKRNLYYHLNEPVEGAPHRKLEKADITAIRAVHVDIDPRDVDERDLQKKQAHLESERQRLKTLVEQLGAGAVAPSICIDSGNGVQLIWRLETKLDARQHLEDVEAQNQGLIEKLGGDRSTRDISRLLRLPGTLNIPGPDKLAKGRTARRSSVMVFRPASYSLEHIAVRYEPVFSVERTDKDPEIKELMKAIDFDFAGTVHAYTDLSADLRARFEGEVSSDERLRDLWQTGVPHGKDKSGSAARFELAERLKRAFFSCDDFGALLWAWDHATQPGKTTLYEMDDYDLRREIARCWAKARAPLDPQDFFQPIPDDAPNPARDDDNPFQSQSAPPKIKLLDLISFDDAVASALEASAKPLVKGFLDQGALSVLYGESNVGKTFVAMDIAFNVSAGLDWAGRRSAHMRVVYVAAEGGRGARRRLAAIARQRGGEARMQPRFHLYPGSVDLLRADADLASLIETVRSVENVGLVVIDTLSRALAGGDENSSTDMGALVKNVDRLRQATDAHVMLVHHSGKDRARGARGHSLLRAATDTEIEIADNDITVTKQRDIDGNFRRTFVLDVVELGNDSDGDAITSCTVRLVSQAEKPSGQPTAVEDEILAVLDRLQEADPEAKGFETDVIVRACRDAGKTMPGETIRTRLRNMETKRLVEKPKRGLWKRKPDNLSGGIASTVSVFLTDLDE